MRTFVVSRWSGSSTRAHHLTQKLEYEGAYRTLCDVVVNDYDMVGVPESVPRDEVCDACNDVLGSLDVRAKRA